ncbi:MAG: LptA/OstA family protein [Proteobacteria bacterium]|jgi:lipopolysaccharide transport protein LptA|nr:LptA/OstA family protein [Pseudomonadota bacterium]
MTELRTIRIALLTAAIAWCASAPAQKAPDRVEVEADRLTIDQGKHSARFVGSVVARYGELTLTCDEMTATYDERGAIASLEARGRVGVRRGDATAEARSARLDVKRKTLVLEGAPVVTRGPHRLSGKRVEVRLDTGAVEVLEARGTFAFPLEGGR